MLQTPPWADFFFIRTKKDLCFDIGKPLLTGNDFETNDPIAFDGPVSGKKYLFCGSGHQPIKVRELNDDRISFNRDHT
jgi:hypothetical protein